MTADDDSTPRTGSKRSTDELPAAELLRYQLKEFGAAIRELRATNVEQNEVMYAIKTELALGTQRFARLGEDIKDLKATRKWGITAVITALGSLALTGLNYFLGKHQ